MAKRKTNKYSNKSSRLSQMVNTSNVMTMTEARQIIASKEQRINYLERQLKEARRMVKLLRNHRDNHEAFFALVNNVWAIVEDKPRAEYTSREELEEWLKDNDDGSSYRQLANKYMQGVRAPREARA